MYEVKWVEEMNWSSELCVAWDIFENYSSGLERMDSVSWNFFNHFILVSFENRNGCARASDVIKKLKSAGIPHPGTLGAFYAHSIEILFIYKTRIKK